MQPISDVLAPGAVVGGRFRLERVVGEGGMGVVWAARDSQGRLFALKFLRDVRQSDPKNYHRFVREAHAAMSVRHPNVAPVYSLEHTPTGAPFLVMDLLEGQSLRERLRRHRTSLSVAECARIMIPVLDAVRAAHAAGVVHRDLKPENVFLHASGTVLVLDFGIAKRLTKDEVSGPTSLTSTGALVGTPVYMAPEQVFAEEDIDARADIWALGVILYECLSGVRPTEGSGLGQVIRAIMEPLRPLQHLQPSLPPDLCAAVMAMLSRNRADRPPLDHVSRILAHYAGSVPSSAPHGGMATLDTSPSTLVGPPSHATQPTTRSSSPALVLVPVLVVGLVLAGGAIAGGVWYWRNRSNEEQASSPTKIEAPIPSTSASVATTAPTIASSSPTATTPPRPTIGAIPTTGATPTASSKKDAGAPVASSSASASASQYVFDMSWGRWAGLGDAHPKIHNALVAAQPQVQTCVPAASPGNVWQVSVTMDWPQQGGHHIATKAVKNGDYSNIPPEAAGIADCVKTKLEAANIPNADGQKDIDGGTAMWTFGYGYFKR